jgi:hypothetical protein
MQLSKNFSLEELTRSATANQRHINNSPDLEVISRLQQLAVNVLQPLREAIGIININCGYRCIDLNKAVGGVPTSQHVKGEAADISGTDNAKIFNYIREHLPFDQLIWEKGNDKQPDWVHVSFSAKNRKQVLKLKDGKYLLL